MQTGTPIAKKTLALRPRRAAPFAAFFAVGILLFAAVPPPAEAATARPPLGMLMNAVDDLRWAGAPPKYGAYWVGEWLTDSGWNGVENALETARAEGVTPVLHWYYWGDNISPDCVEYGCSDRSRSEWTSMTNTLASKIKSIMGGAETIVVLENEFNKNGITDSWYAPKFDAHLEGVAKQLDAVPGVKLVLGFGAWGESSWTKFPRAAAQSDYIGFQMMRASTKDSEDKYRQASDKILYYTNYIDEKFDKPAFLYDLALSSYPDAKWERMQAEELQDIFDILDHAGTTGLQGVVYRSLEDNPDMGLHNYYGYAERHWGLKKHDGAAKPAWNVWKAYATGSSTDSGSSAFDASFTGVKVEEWWVQTSVSANQYVSKVEARVDGGSWVALTKESYGWARSVHVESGECVEFRATASDGSTDVSAKTCRPGSVALDASFRDIKVDEWWVQTSVGANKGVSKVEARVNGGSWIALPKQSWGAYAKSFHVAAGACVEFQATATDGSKDVGGKTCRPGSAAFDAGYHDVQVKEWWVQTSLDANEPVSKVDARVNGGSWTSLPKQSWGAYAKSIHVKSGQYVEFRTTSSDGSVDYSGKYYR